MSNNRKVALYFLQGWSLFNKGDVAGFDADHAQQLIDAKIAQEALDQPVGAEAMTLSMQSLIDGDMAEVMVQTEDYFAHRERALDQRSAGLDQRAGEIERREVDLASRHADLDQQAADLATRAAELDQREADLAVREGATTEAPAKSKTK